MRKLQLNATELVDPSVNFVSLVKRGANRIPFRIMKKDDEMLDLHQMGRRLFAKAEARPEIVAAIIQKGVDVNKVAEIFKSHGLDPKQFVKSEKDGVITVAKADADLSDAMVVKVHKDVGLVVTGLKKIFDGFTFDSTSFGDVLAAGGYCSSLGTAADMLRVTVGNILVKAESPDEAASAIQKACDDHKKYVVALTKGLPSTAFRVEADLMKADLAGSPAGDEAPVADTTTATAAVFEDPAAPKQTEQAAAGAGAEVQKGDPAGEPEKKEVAKEESVESGDAAAAAAAPAAEQKPADNSDVLAAIAALQKTFTEQLAGVKGDVQKTAGELTTRIDQVAERARKTDAALNGTVFSEPGNDQTKVTKTEAGYNPPPLLDTGFDRRNAA